MMNAQPTDNDALSEPDSDDVGQESPVERESVSRTVEDLLADYRRQGEWLSLEQVERLTSKRKLGGRAFAQILQALERHGATVEFPDDDNRGSQDAPSEEQARSTGSAKGASAETAKSDSIATLPRALFDRQLLGPQAEREMAYRLRVGISAKLSLENEELDSSSRALLLKGIEDGEQAREQLILSNTRLVAWLARRYAEVCPLPFEDLFQDGILGLFKAVEKFDPDLGFRLSTYATHWIIQSITRAIAKTRGIIRVPDYMQRAVAQLRRASRGMMTEGRTPNLRNLADELNWDAERVHFVYSVATMSVCSTSEPLAAGTGGDGAEMGDVLPSPTPGPDELVALQDDIDQLYDALHRLDDRAQTILTQRFGLGGDSMTLKEIGEDIGITRERVRQLESDALLKLQSTLTKLQRLKSNISGRYLGTQTEAEAE